MYVDNEHGGTERSLFQTLNFLLATVQHSLITEQYKEISQT
jgi:hypothetical protein